MVQLGELFDLNLFGQMHDEGYITVRQHDTAPLSVANYTAKAQYERNWNEVTRQCRGLIYDHGTLEVVARPFPKFHNWDEGGVQYPPTGPCLRMPKMDGSLGILYGNEIATRGSFNSEQAKWATAFFQRTQRDLPGFFVPDPAKTYLFEIIYPDNRIVVDYGEYEGLVLIDVIDTATGLMDTDEFDNCQWPDKVVRKHVPGFDSGQAVEIPEGDEGFVYAWPTRNFRTKMKAAEYVELHRLVTGLNEKTVWQAMCEGRVEALKEKMPEEFVAWIDRVSVSIANDVRKVVESVSSAYTEIGDVGSRKEFALAAVKYKGLTPYLFALYDGRDIVPMALKQCNPKKVTGFVSEEEV